MEKYNYINEMTEDVKNYLVENNFAPEEYDMAKDYTKRNEAMEIALNAMIAMVENESDVYQLDYMVNNTILGYPGEELVVWSKEHPHFFNCTSIILAGVSLGLNCFINEEKVEGETRVQVRLYYPILDNKE